MLAARLARCAHAFRIGASIHAPKLQFAGTIVKMGLVTSFVAVCNATSKCMDTTQVDEVDIVMRELLVALLLQHELMLRYSKVLSLVARLLTLRVHPKTNTRATLMTALEVMSRSRRQCGACAPALQSTTCLVQARSLPSMTASRHSVESQSHSVLRMQERCRALGLVVCMFVPGFPNPSTDGSHAQEEGESCLLWHRVFLHTSNSPSHASGKRECL